MARFNTNVFETLNDFRAYYLEKDTPKGWKCIQFNYSSLEELAKGIIQNTRKMGTTVLSGPSQDKSYARGQFSINFSPDGCSVYRELNPEEKIKLAKEIAKEL